MKAYRLFTFGAFDHLQQIEEEAPRPRHGEVLVRVHAVSLNYRDLAMLRKQYPMPHKAALIPTSDAAGEIIAVGDGVDDLRVGDRVMSTFHPRWYAGPPPANVSRHAYGSEKDGWLTEQKIVSQEALVRIPEGMTYEDAATLPCAAVTAWNALTGGARAVRVGDTVLTLGTGGVSIFAVQLAGALGATVISTTSSPGKAEKLRQIGAAHVIRYDEVAQWGAKARTFTDGYGIDLVVEVGGSGTLGESLQAVRAGGEIASVGFLSSATPSIDFSLLFGSQATFRSISVGSRAVQQDVVKVMEKAGVRPVIDRCFGFSAAREAFRYLATGNHFGKVVIRVTD